MQLLFFKIFLFEWKWILIGLQGFIQNSIQNTSIKYKTQSLHTAKIMSNAKALSAHILQSGNGLVYYLGRGPV